ncbi:amidohydrolase [Desulfofalx alkaliphila]|uniref:amidohydrolase n=1 Tax=Desulfofalx alkaliphila TaxID=105483 RepID=UPI0004E15E33|nr:amidohydrolase [Desulfofalx alkaliphila]
MQALVGGTVYTVTNGVIENGTVLIDGGKIIEVGEKVAIPAGCTLVDVSGKKVFPGLIDAHTHLGIFEEVYRVEGSDGNETSDPVTPELRAVDAINPGDAAFADALSGGVTTVVIGPGSANVIGGEMVVLKTAGNLVDKMVVKKAGIKAALGENPKRVYGGDKKAPITRMANALLLRRALAETINFIEKKSNERNLKLEALVPVIEGKLPLRIHAHRADDIATAVRIAKEFNIKITIEHCTEGYKVADLLAENNIPVVIGPIITNRAKVELQGVSLQNAAALHAAGVKFAIMTDHPEVPIHYLSLSAALTLRAGLPEEEMLKAITINAAEILGLEDRLGSIEANKDADLIVTNYPLYDIRCQVEQLYIQGERVNW